MTADGALLASVTPQGAMRTSSAHYDWAPPARGVPGLLSTALSKSALNAPHRCWVQEEGRASLGARPGPPEHHCPTDCLPICPSRPKGHSAHATAPTNPDFGAGPCSVLPCASASSRLHPATSDVDAPASPTPVFLKATRPCAPDPRLMLLASCSPSFLPLQQDEVGKQEPWVSWVRREDTSPWRSAQQQKQPSPLRPRERLQKLPPYARLIPLEEFAFFGAELCLAGNSQCWVWEAMCPVSADLLPAPTPCPRVGHQRRTGLLCGLHRRWVEGPIPRLDPAAVKPSCPTEEEDCVGPGLHAPGTICEGRPTPSAWLCSRWWLSLGNRTPGCH